MAAVMVVQVVFLPVLDCCSTAMAPAAVVEVQVDTVVMEVLVVQVDTIKQIHKTNLQVALVQVAQAVAVLVLAE